MAALGFRSLVDAFAFKADESNPNYIAPPAKVDRVVLVDIKFDAGVFTINGGRHSINKGKPFIFGNKVHGARRAAAAVAFVRSRRLRSTVRSGRAAHRREAGRGRRHCVDERVAAASR